METKNFFADQKSHNFKLKKELAKLKGEVKDLKEFVESAESTVARMERSVSGDDNPLATQLEVDYDPDCASQYAVSQRTDVRRSSMGYSERAVSRGAASGGFDE